MRYTKFLVFICIMLLSLQCSNRHVEIAVPEHTDRSMVAQIQSEEHKGTPFPEGSKAVKTDKEEAIMIVLPDDVYFVVKKNNGDVFMIKAIGVSCSCSQGSGCSPVKHDGSYYCVMNENCRMCSMTTKDVKFKYNLVILGLMDTRIPVRLFSSTDGSIFTTTTGSRQYGICEDFFACKEVQDEIKNLYKVIYNENIPDFIKENSYEIPDDYTFVKVDFFGNDILVPVLKNDETISQLNLITLDLIKARVSCTCNKGSGCVLKSLLGVKYCDAGDCSNCSLDA